MPSIQLLLVCYRCKYVLWRKQIINYSNYSIQVLKIVDLIRSGNMSTPRATPLRMSRSAQVHQCICPCTTAATSMHTSTCISNAADTEHLCTRQLSHVSMPTATLANMSTHAATAACTEDMNNNCRLYGCFHACSSGGVSPEDNQGSEVYGRQLLKGVNKHRLAANTPVSGEQHR